MGMAFVVSHSDEMYFWRQEARTVEGRSGRKWLTSISSLCLLGECSLFRLVISWDWSDAHLSDILMPWFHINSFSFELFSYLLSLILVYVAWLNEVSGHVFLFLNIYHVLHLLLSVSVRPDRPQSVARLHKDIMYVYAAKVHFYSPRSRPCGSPLTLYFSVKVSEQASETPSARDNSRKRGH